MKTTHQEIQLTDSELSIRIHAHGAELSSIKRQDVEYLWQADPTFWGRHSPVLFPIVGAVWNKTYRVEGKEYQLSQHGFARDMDFEVVSVQPDEAWFKLESNADTLQKYPFPFDLNIGYQLEGNKIHVKWRVYNPADHDLHFQIGAHPAFYFQGEPKGDLKGYFRLKPADTPVWVSRPISFSTRAYLALTSSMRSWETRPISRPYWVSRRSALSWRSSSRYSLREVMMR